MKNPRLNAVAKRPWSVGSLLPLSARQRAASGPAHPPKPPTKARGFTILELLLSMAIFVMAAVSLAQALNIIGLSVSESVDASRLREKMRAVHLEVTRDPGLRIGTRETNADPDGVSFRIEVEPASAESQNGVALQGIVEVDITALSPDGEVLDTTSTLIYLGLF